MTDREKLYDLIVDAENELYKNNHYAEDSKRIESEVEYLISHGVTVRQMQKPLTVEELKEIYFMREDHVWPHERKPPYLYLDSSIEKNDHLWVAWSRVVNFLETGYRQYTVESYGKTWRCWAEKPTNEERQAAEWER